MTVTFLEYKFTEVDFEDLIYEGKIEGVDVAVARTHMYQACNGRIAVFPLSAAELRRSAMELSAGEKSDLIPRCLLLQPGWLPEWFRPLLLEVVNQLYYTDAHHLFDVPDQYSDRTRDYLRHTYLKLMLTEPIPSPFCFDVVATDVAAVPELADDSDTEKGSADGVVLQKLVDDEPVNDVVHYDTSSDDYGDDDFEDNGDDDDFEGSYGDVMAVVEHAEGVVIHRGLRYIITDDAIYECGDRIYRFSTHESACQRAGELFSRIGKSDLVARCLLLSDHVKKKIRDWVYSIVCYDRTAASCVDRLWMPGEKFDFTSEEIFASDIVIGCRQVKTYGFFGERRRYLDFVRWLATTDVSDDGDPFRYGFCYLLLYNRSDWCDIMETFDVDEIPLDLARSRLLSSRSDLSLVFRGNCAHITVGGDLSPGRILDLIERERKTLVGSQGDATDDHGVSTGRCAIALVLTIVFILVLYFVVAAVSHTR